MQNLSDLPPCVFGEIGRLLASAELLKRGISVSKPEVDTGFDIVTFHGGRACRIQVKTTSNRVPPSQVPKYRSETRSNRFSVRGGPGRTSDSYVDMGVDAFVFVRLIEGEHAFWVVPTGAIKARFYVHLRDDSEWRDAWHVLLSAGDANAA